MTNIKETRIKHGLTMKQVSELTGVPYRSLQNWEAEVRHCPDYVEQMVVTMIEQKFGQPDYKVVLEEILEMIESDIRYVKSEETKNYLNNLIEDIGESLHK